MVFQKNWWKYLRVKIHGVVRIALDHHAWVFWIVSSNVISSLIVITFPRMIYKFTKQWPINKTQIRFNQHKNDKITCLDVEVLWQLQPKSYKIWRSPQVIERIASPFCTWNNSLEYSFNDCQVMTLQVICFLTSCISF